MKDIKKYLDNIFKELKEVIDQVNILTAYKIDPSTELLDSVNKQVKKTYHKV